VTLLASPWALVFVALAPVILWLSARRRIRALLVPSIAFYPDAPMPQLGRRRPPASGWCAAAACVAGALAAAGLAAPRARSVIVLFDPSPAMHRLDARGESRLVRARKAAGAAIAELPAGSELWVYSGAALLGSGSAGEAARIVASVGAASRLDDRGALAIPGSGEKETWVFTGGVEPHPRAARVYRFGASAENVGIVAFSRSSDGGRIGVVVGNGGQAKRNITIRVVTNSNEPSVAIPVELGPKESKLVELQQMESPAIAIEPADGLLDSFPLDNKIETGEAVVEGAFDASTPAALRQAIVALRPAGAAGGGARRAVRCVPLGSPPNATIPSIEFAPAKGNNSEFRAHALALAPNVTIPARDIAGRHAATAVEASEPWIVDADSGETIAGVSGHTARIGIELRSGDFPASPLFPILVSALVDRILDIAPGSDRDPRLTMEAGALADSIETGTATQLASPSGITPWIASLAAALAAAAAFLAFRGR
jgi:hypothetical protein